MPGTSSDSNSKLDSARELMAGWNISGDSQISDDQSLVDGNGLAPSQPPSAHFGWDRLGGTKRGGSPSSRGRSIARSVELLAGFELEESANECGSTRAHAPAFDDARPGSPSGSRPRRSGASGASAPRAHGGLPHPGDEIAGFRIILELGRGAFARVYLAEEVNLGRRLVAIKVSRPDGDEPQILARLQHTHIVPVHSVCDDPVSGLRILCMPYFGGANLAQVLDAVGGRAPVGHDGRSLVEALDHISRSLPALSTRGARPSSLRRSRLSRPNPSELAGTANLSTSKRSYRLGTSRFRSLFSRWVGPRAYRPPVAESPDAAQPSRQFLHGASAIQAAVWIVARLADGLEHAHSRGLLHRDLKPSNVLLAGDGTPMLLDFNLAVEQAVESPEGEMRRALVGGTMPYMSPEHLDAFNPRGSTAPDCVDERSDIYAMGLILFEMLAGEHPFPSPPPATPMLESIELMIAARRKPPSLRACSSEIPWSLDALVAKCLAPDPAHRYQRAGDLAEDLRRFLENQPMKHCPEPSVRERMGKFARRHPGLCGSTSIAAISAVLLGVLAGTFALVYDTMQELAARVQIKSFDREYTEIQFLLNTAGSSPERLKKGIAMARATMGKLGVDTAGQEPWRAWQHRLTPEEQGRLREQVAELIMLDARAFVTLATARGSEADRRRAIERAVVGLDRAERIGRPAPSALYLERARYHAALGLAGLAARDRELAAARAPATCHDFTLLGTTLLVGGDSAGAEQAVKQALHLDVTSFWAWFVLGHCHFAQGRYLEAAGDFAACSARGPRFAWAHFNRGLALANAGRLIDAQHAYDRALELDGKFVEALVDRGLVELELDQLDRAKNDLIGAVELGRNDVVVFAALGETWARLGQRSEAESYFARLLDSNPSDAVVRVARGMTRVRTDPEGARADFAHVLKQEPSQPQAHYGMALLVRQTDLPGALAHLDRALESNPNLIDAVQLRALVRARLGQRSALDDVRRLIESATPGRLYNAACAVAILSEKAEDPRLVSHAVELLSRAIKSGFLPAEVWSDPDLKPLHDSPQFEKLVAECQPRTAG
jgi:serine/threonine protein kinase/tetratricopeptide (TPR) repeat protein